MSTINIAEAQARLPDLIQELAPGEEIVITQDGLAVAKLVGQCLDEPRPVFGRGRGKVTIVSEDDDHLQDFEEYLP